MSVVLGRYLHLHQHGCEPTDTDLCVYVCCVFISLYTNNCTIIASDSLLQPTKDVLAKFNMTDLGKATLVLSIACVMSSTACSLWQTSHINAILECYRLTNCKAMSLMGILEYISMLPW